MCRRFYSDRFKHAAGERAGWHAHLTEHGGKTLLTMTILYPSKEARDATIASAMEHGVAAGYNRLEELLATPTGG